METGQLIGVVVAGGLSRRLGGGDKFLRRLNGKRVLEHVLDRVRPQVGTLVLNANGDPARLAEFALPVVPDTVPGHAGPLAGVLAGMDWAGAHRPAIPLLLTVAADTPFLPLDLAVRLRAGLESEGAEIACASSGGRLHPLFGLWPVALAGALRQALLGEGVRRVRDWLARRRTAVVAFAAEPIDPFFNLNRPEDLAVAERLVATEEGCHG